MFQGGTVVTIALAYLGVLFAIAYYGDRWRRSRSNQTFRTVIYALTLAVYCTSWTFFGSVGLAAKTGLDFLPIYLGPILMIGLGWRVLRRIVVLSKQQNITSIADFIAARYGKNQALGAIVAVIAVIGTLPYISLQLKAVSTSLSTLLSGIGTTHVQAMPWPVFGDLALLVALLMAAFSALFGTRHIDTTEHQDGLMLAIAAESVVKLAAFLAVGAVITFSLFDGFGDLLEQARQRTDITQLFTRGFDGGRWLTMTLLSMMAIFLLPRQFHVAVVENKDPRDIRKAAWLFPLYLIAINLFVVPIAVAGLLTFPPGSVDGDTFVLALPLAAGNEIITVIAFIGGLSAATAMVIVATIALSIMVCNDLVVPAILRFHANIDDPHEDMGRLLLYIRRTAIFAILLLAYSYYWMVGDSFALASIGLLSFAAIAQFAPALFGGLIWRRATARGAIAGVVAGFLVWAYTLLLPSFVNSGWMPATLLTEGPFGIALLRPEVLFNLEFEPLTHGVLWSLIANIAAYVSVSLITRQSPIERLQASIFVSSDLAVPAHGFRLWRSAVTVGDLERTVSRYLGRERTRRSFDEFAATRDVVAGANEEADIRHLRHAEYLLASAIGAASSRLVLALLLERRNLNTRGAIRLLDDASAAIQYNRDLLQSALDHVSQGIAVFDRNLKLTCWNTQYRVLLNIPEDLGRVGVPLEEIIRHNAEKGEFGEGDVEKIVAERIERYVVSKVPFLEQMTSTGAALEIRCNAMPDGGVVTTVMDITDRVDAARALTRANETLERRVSERTAELVEVNHALALAKSEAEAANLGKTRFLAAASHDILQPLNAARLYATTLAERGNSAADRDLVQNLDASLESVEEILGVLLDISRLDAGALTPEISTFRLDDLLGSIAANFEPLAKEHGNRLRVVASSLPVRSDRRMLRRVLQNFLSNAIKYTTGGTVLVGARRAGDHVRLEVHDTGAGISPADQEVIFEEFRRLRPQGQPRQGIGLGLSIVRRICRVLDHPVQVRSKPGRGSVFAVSVPIASTRDLPMRDAARAAPLSGKIAGLQLLCIDNEPRILDGMSVMLGGWGCQVTTALGLEEAIVLLEADAWRPDVVLADYHLDDEDGLSAIALLREKYLPDIPAILITADRSRKLRTQAKEAGISLLNKPIRPAALRAIVSRYHIRRQAAE